MTVASDTIKQVEEIVDHLRDRAADASREAHRLEAVIGDIPDEGRWMPFRIKKKGVPVINTAVTLEVDKAYVVKNANGQTVSVWTDSGWTQVGQMPALSKLTHIWMPRKK